MSLTWCQKSRKLTPFKAEMEHFKPPGTFSFDGNLSENWRRWVQRYELYLTASGANEKEEKTQVAILLHTIGEEGLEIFNTFVFTEGEEHKLLPVLTKFCQYCNPRKNTVMERYTFWEKVQKEGESIDQFVTSLKNHAKNCDFGDQKDFMIRDRIIFGVRDARLKERLLRDSADPKLERVVELCRASEASSRQVIQLAATAPISVNAISKTKTNKRPFNKHYTKSTGYPPKQHAPNPTQFQCRNCGNSHGKRECPAYGKSCLKCNKKNHFAKMCRSAIANNSPGKVHALVEEVEPALQSLFIGELQVGQLEAKNPLNAWYAELKLSCSKSPVKFKLDTGAEANILPQRLYHRLSNKPDLVKTQTILSAYGGQKLRPCGQISTSINSINVDLYVVDVDSPAILGLNTCQELRLIERVESIERGTLKQGFEPLTRDSLVRDFSDVFTGLGKFKGEYKIEVDSNVKPVVHPPRKVPFSLQNKLKETIEKLEKDNVIAVVEEPTEWVNSIVIVEKKDGSLRLCLDPRDLNTAIKREHFQIPTAEDVAAELHGKKVFSILDEKDGYWQVQLDYESSFLCTFNTPFGRYRFKRMPFGISSASEVFQKKNQQIFGDIKGVNMIADDMIIAAENNDEHDAIVRKVMTRAREQNVKFNPNKVQFKVDTVQYMGHVITQEGLKADDKKITAIVNMPAPEDKQALQRILGMVNYFSKFIPRMAEITAPLRLLLKKDSKWIWDANHDRAFQEIKDALTNSPVLKFFDPSKPITIQADASQNGLGACLLQEKPPIAYASRSLTAAEKNYAQIEKELLAIVFACNKFHQYIYGKQVEVQSDHKPLEAIIKKPLCKASPRLQRMLLRLQRYQIGITYVPGKFMYIADTLSRAYLSNMEESKLDQEFNEDMDVMIPTLVTNLSASDNKREQLQQATVRDPELHDLLSMVRSGWPERKSDTFLSVRQYFHLQDEIHEAEGLLFCGDRLIIPRDMRKEMLTTIHECHLGMEKCKSRARLTLYWPGMSTEIDDYISKCATCNRYKRKQQKEPLIPHEIPERPWQKLGMDLFEYGARDYLVVVDYFSIYPEISVLENKTAGTVILHLKSMLARHGIPETIMSDNMPFNSKEFKDFARSWDIELVTSSPTYPQSNGLSERMDQTIKNILRINGDPYMALLEYRNTPLSGMSYSPAQMLMSRTLRFKIPARNTILIPKIAQDAREQLKYRQGKHKHFYDQHAKSLSDLIPGDVVRMRVQKTWEPAVVQTHHAKILCRPNTQRKILQEEQESPLENSGNTSSHRRLRARRYRTNCVQDTDS